MNQFPGEPAGKNSYLIGKAEIGIAQYAEDDVKHRSPAGTLIRTIKVQREFRRQGYAREALSQITKWADRTQTTLYLWTDPYDDQPMSERQLKRFYSQFGFKTYVGRIMRRSPDRRTLR